MDASGNTHNVSAEEVLTVAVAVNALADAITDACLIRDPLMQRKPVRSAIHTELSMAAEDAFQMILGIPDIATWGEGVER